MKTYQIILTLIAAVSLSRAPVLAQLTPTPTPPNWDCKLSSWNPEAYTFYGSKEIVAGKLAKIPTKLSERRVFLQVTQGDASAQVNLFEQQKDGTFTVTEWTTKHSAALLDAIDAAIMSNKGVNCVGEEMKTILNKQLKAGKISTSVAVPDSPQEGLKPQVEKASGNFIKTIVIFGC